LKIYVLVNFLTVLFPVLLSFERRVSYFSKWPAVFISIIPTAVVFIVWDMIAVSRGHWGFNPEHVYGIRVLGLPIEEMLFFICIPFSCVFILECVSYFIRPRRLNIPRFVFIAISAAAVLTAILVWPREYTAVVFVSAGIFFSLGGTLFYRTLTDANYWISMLIVIIPFVIVNGVLTSLPVISYNPEHISGIRLGTIPVEDAVYNLVLIGSVLASYRFINADFSDPDKTEP